MLNLLYLMTANTGFICLVKILSNVNLKRSKAINTFLLVIFLFQSIRFMIYGMDPFFEQPGGEKFWIIDMLNGMIIPCYYLYFVDLIDAPNARVNKILHLSWVPVSLILLLLGLRFTNVLETRDERYKFLFSTAMLIFIAYAVLIFRLLNRHVWNRSSDLKTVNRQNRIIRNWATFIFFGFLLMLLRSLVGFYYNDFTYRGGSQSMFLWVAAIFWTSIFIKLMITPEILYGLSIFNKMDEKMAPHNLLMSEIWSADKPIMPVENERDKKLQEKITPQLLPYLHRIESKLLFTDALKNPEFSQEDLAAETGIPSSHLSYIFRYHSHESFTDCKKILRIREAVRILEEGNLQALTFEAISQQVGFNSYTTFFNSFKSITGKTPLEVKFNRHPSVEQ